MATVEALSQTSVHKKNLTTKLHKQRIIAEVQYFNARVWRFLTSAEAKRLHPMVRSFAAAGYITIRAALLARQFAVDTLLRILRTHQIWHSTTV